jgi:ribosome-associated protein
MDNNIEKLVDMVIDAMEDLKAKDIHILNVQDASDFTDRMVIASGNSDRQVKAIAENVVDKFKSIGQRPLGVEGSDGWYLVDLGDIVVHVMLPATRDFYQIEKLWTTDDSPE